MRKSYACDGICPYTTIIRPPMREPLGHAIERVAHLNAVRRTGRK